MAKGGKFMNFIGDGNSMVMNSQKMTIEDEARLAATQEHNKAVQKEIEERKARQLKEEAEKAAKVKGEFGSMEIMPLMGNVLVRPYAKNPFEKFELSESGIILSSFDGSFDNPDTGTRDKQDNAIVFADVIEVGPEVKNIQTGDIIMFRNHSQLPVPFFGEGFYVTHQNNVLVAINKGLTERMKLNK